MFKKSFKCSNNLCENVFFKLVSFPKPLLLEFTYLKYWFYRIWSSRAFQCFADSQFLCALKTDYRRAKKKKQISFSSNWMTFNSISENCRGMQIYNINLAGKEIYDRKILQRVASIMYRLAFSSLLLLVLNELHAHIAFACSSTLANGRMQLWIGSNRDQVRQRVLCSLSE